jgi:hypothetical protein
VDNNFIINKQLSIMKKTSLLLVALLSVSTAFAQISTGEPHSSVIPRTGNRPQAGDFGLYLGASVTQIIDLVKLNKDPKFGTNAFWALPAINLKYYFTDNLEGRLGFQFACQSSTKKRSDNNDDGTWIKRTQDVNYTRFLPGVAYHFNTNNIIDVYLGAQVPIGFNIDQEKRSAYTGTINTSTTEKNNQFVLGAGIFLGLQVFIADLPFAIGLETGYSGQAHFSGGHRRISTVDGEKQIDLIDAEIGGNDIKSASFIDATWGADAAITFTYYFHN